MRSGRGWMEVKNHLRGNKIFALFLILGSAMDSDNRAVIEIMVLAMLLVFYCMGQDYGKEDYEE